jgi:general secretion pathway protein L
MGDGKLKARRGEAFIWLPPRACGERALASSPSLLVMSGARLGAAQEPLCQRSSLETLPALRAVRLIFDARDVTMLRARLPRLPQARLARALPGLLEDQVLQDAQQCVWALDRVPLPSGEQRVAVIDRGWFETVLQAFERRRIRVLSAWPMQAVARPSTGTGWLYAMPEGLALCTSSGEGLGWPAAATAQARALQAGELHSIARELGSPIERIQLGDPAWTSAFDAGQAQALDWPQACSLDLLAGRRAGRQSSWLDRVDWRAWRPAAALAGLALLIALVGLNLEWARLAAEERRLSARVQGSFRNMLGENTPMVDPVLQMSRQLALLRLRAGQPDPDGFVSLLARLSEALGPAESDALLTLQYRDGQLNLRLRAGAAGSAAVRERLIEASRLQGLELAFESGRDGQAVVRPLR